MDKCSLLVLGVILVFCGVCGGQTYRNYDGTGNNQNNPSWGSVGASHIQPPTYSLSYNPDGNTLTTSLPSPREISNALFSSLPSRPYNPRSVSDLHTYWGQFVDHDITLTPTDDERADISVPTGDEIFDPYSTGSVTLPFYRSAHVAGTGYPGVPRNQYNLVTSFLDASHIYGSNETRAAILREKKGGRLWLQTNKCLPYNTFGLDNANPVHSNPKLLFVAGDIRVNENPGLSVLHTIFAREHNRLADQFAAKNPSWTDEKLYQEARRWVGALMAAITFNEYVPVTLGSSLPAYTGYKPSVNPGIMSLFTAMAFRYGHSEVNTWIPRLGADGNPIEKGGILFRDSYFRPSKWVKEGVEPILRGAASQVQQDVDLFYVDDIRNFLFGLPNSGGVDLAAYSIQRGRDHGLPSYNDIRTLFGLDPALDFSEISSSREVAIRLEIYGSVDRVDGFVGGLAEDKRPFSNLGSLFNAIVSQQYQNIRDGDRFYYKNSAVSGFTQAEIQQIDATRLSHIILRNTNISQIQCDAFYTFTTKMCYLKADGTIGTVTPTSPTPTPTTPPHSPTPPPTPSGSNNTWAGTNITLVTGEVIVNYVMPTDRSSSLVTFRLAVKNNGVGWIGLGFPTTPEKMVPSEAVIGFPPQVTRASGSVQTYSLNEYQLCEGNVGVCPTNAFAISNTAIAVVDGWTVMTFAYVVADVTSIPIVYAFGVSNTLSYHGPNQGSAVIVPSDPCGGHQNTISINFSLVSAHGALMIIAYLIFFPIGVALPAFGRKLGNLWFTLHVVFQITAIFFMAMAFMIILVFSTQYGKGHFRNGHGVFGLIVILLTIITMSFGATAANMYDPERTATPLFPDQIHRYVALLTLFFAFINILVGSGASSHVTGDEHSFFYWAVLVVYELIVVGIYIGLSLLKRYRPAAAPPPEEEFPK